MNSEFLSFPSGRPAVPMLAVTRDNAVTARNVDEAELTGYPTPDCIARGCAQIRTDLLDPLDHHICQARKENPNTIMIITQ